LSEKSKWSGHSFVVQLEHHNRALATTAQRLKENMSGTEAVGDYFFNRKAEWP
jgi:hypothetical protein